MHIIASDIECLLLWQTNLGKIVHGNVLTRQTVKWFKP